MNKPRISIIVAIDDERGIGRENTLPWYIPEDLKRFKEITSGHPVIMGRKTYESIGRLLPKRVNIIITRDTHFSVEGAVITHSLNDAIGEAKKHDDEEIFVIGGGQVFSEALTLADRLYLTLVKGIHNSTVFFPEYASFTKTISEEHGESNGKKYTFLTLEKY